MVYLNIVMCPLRWSMSWEGWMKKWTNLKGREVKKRNGGYLKGNGS